MASKMKTLNEPSGMLGFCRVEQKAKSKGIGSTLEEARSNYAIKTSVTANKLLLCCVILKKMKKKMKSYKKENCVYLKKKLPFFFTFWLSYYT